MKHTVTYLSVWIFLVSGCNLLVSCGTVGRVGLNTAAPAAPQMVDHVMQMNNLKLAREGLPGIIVLISSLLEFTPGNLDLLTVAAMSYTAYGLIMEDDDPVYASELYLLGKEYGLRALKTNPRFEKEIAGKGVNMIDAVTYLDKKYAPALFWTGMSWASWIFLHFDEASAPLGLPTIFAFMNRCEVLNEAYFFGGVHLFYLAYNAVMPSFAGGGGKKVDAEFEKVLSFSNGSFMLPYVYYAKFYSKPQGMKGKFHDHLTRVIQSKTIDKSLNLVNEVAREKAKRLLAKEQEYFLYED